MTNRIMLRACASENAVSIQTFSARMKSPQWFYISYEELIASSVRAGLSSKISSPSPNSGLMNSVTR